MLVRNLVLLFSSLFVVSGLVACSGDDDSANGSVSSAPSETPEPIFDAATEPTDYQRIEFELVSSLDRGAVDIYALVDGELTPLTDLTFHNSPFRNFVQYSSLASTTESILLFRVRANSALIAPGKELYCFAPIRHQIIRHKVRVNCDSASTMTFFMSAQDGVVQVREPFLEISSRLPIWRSYYRSQHSDLTAFLVSTLATIENALLGLGAQSFDSEYRPVRPVMEAIAVHLLDSYQVDGLVSSRELIDFAQNATGFEIPLGRLLRFKAIFDEFKHIEPVDIQNTGGSLTRLTRQVQLPTLENELQRFFLLQSPLEMSDYRTHLVQNVRFDDAMNLLQWDALPHMYGYNVYVDGLHIGYTQSSRIRITVPDPRTAVIKAVGHAGEFGGVDVRFSDQLLASVDSDGT